MTFLIIGDRESYHTVCAALLAQSEKSAVTDTAESSSIAWLQTVAPGTIYSRPEAVSSGTAPAILLAFLQHHRDPSRLDARGWSDLLVEGAIKFRGGQFEDATRLLEQGVQRLQCERQHGPS